MGRRSTPISPQAHRLLQLSPSTTFDNNSSADLPDRARWTKLTAIGMTFNQTTRNGKQTVEVRYYILSKKLTARRFAEAVRSHWSIENQLHWQLDVTFQEDQSRLREGHAATNFSLVRLGFPAFDGRWVRDETDRVA